MTQIPPPPELVPHLFERKVNDETKKQEDSVILNALVGFWYSNILFQLKSKFFSYLKRTYHGVLATTNILVCLIYV